MIYKVWKRFDIRDVSANKLRQLAVAGADVKYSQRCDVDVVFVIEADTVDDALGIARSYDERFDAVQPMTIVRSARG